MTTNNSHHSRCCGCLSLVSLSSQAGPFLFLQGWGCLGSVCYDRPSVQPGSACQLESRVQSVQIRPGAIWPEIHSVTFIHGFSDSALKGFKSRRGIWYNEAVWCDLKKVANVTDSFSAGCITLPCTLNNYITKAYIIRECTGWKPF